MSMLTSFRASSGAVSVPSVGAGGADETSDEFRLIKWHFLANASAGTSSGKNTRVILITSARPGEGKSYVAHHLAANFALDPHTELTLIDANFENPALGSSSWMGGSSGGVGLLDYLDGTSMDQSSVLKSTGLSNVKVILAGNARENAPELLANGRLEQLLASCTGANGFVIIDAGSVLSNGGAAVIGRYAGQISFVIAANTTNRSDITQSLSTLDRIAGPIDEKSLGLIFN
jgi:Mrp family chromosome partitioning ATPase